ncbi:hypothetical protein C0992_012847 [Termitomyces sp. T32_za158]|nr:hypothetical protein C0992_012847 [Termitomyces sp. T32_za158]
MQTLDRYVVPPVASVMQIAESYAAPLQPYAASTVDFAQTIIPHIYSFVGSCLFYYDTEVGPRLRRLLVDQLWNSTIKPSYFDILHPTLKRHIYPFYNNYLSPGVRKGTAYAQAAYVRSLPHAKHYLSNAQKNAARISKIVRLHAVNLYVRLRPHITMFLDQVHMLVLVIARKASDLRREFIDPHVRKMLDKVAEKWGPLFG